MVEQNIFGVQDDQGADADHRKIGIVLQLTATKENWQLFEITHKMFSTYGGSYFRLHH